MRGTRHIFTPGHFESGVGSLGTLSPVVKMVSFVLLVSEIVYCHRYGLLMSFTVLVLFYDV